MQRPDKRPANPNQQAVLAWSEREFQSNVIELAQVFGCEVYHTFDSRRSEAGFPDLVICGRSGILFRELKAEGGVTSAAQQRWLAAFIRAGGDAGLWYPQQWLSGHIKTEIARVSYAR